MQRHGVATTMTTTTKRTQRIVRLTRQRVCAAEGHTRNWVDVAYCSERDALWSTELWHVQYTRHAHLDFTYTIGGARVPHPDDDDDDDERRYPASWRQSNAAHARRPSR